MKVRDCLTSVAQGTPADRLDREVMLAHVLGKTRSWLYAYDDDLLEPVQVEGYQQLLQQRQSGQPLAYLLGYRDFWDHRFVVSPDCLIPRIETELLVERCLECLPKDQPCQILELGTGSGAIAISLALERPDCQIVATDASASALALARHNAHQLSAEQIDFRLGDWYAPVNQTSFDLIVSNPPYIRSDDPHLLRGDLPAEPSQALVAGIDGLDAYRQIIPGSLGYLSAHGSLLLEHGHDQRADLISLCQDAGFKQIEIHDDLSGVPRVVIAGRG